MQCEYNGCKERARFALFRILENGSKVWVNVCRQCTIGIEKTNLRRQRRRRVKGVS